MLVEEEIKHRTFDCCVLKHIKKKVSGVRNINVTLKVIVIGFQIIILKKHIFIFDNVLFF